MVAKGHSAGTAELARMRDAQQAAQAVVLAHFFLVLLETQTGENKAL